MSAKDLSQFYQILTPGDRPLLFCVGGFYRLIAQCRCVACGGQVPITINCHKVYRQDGPLGLRRKNPEPDPKDQQIISSFMLAACNHGCGCARRDNFFTDSVGNLQPKIFETFFWKSEFCLHEPDKTCGLCEPCKRPVRWLKWAPHLHSRGCHVGQMVRTGPFRVEGMQCDQRARAKR